MCCIYSAITYSVSFISEPLTSCFSALYAKFVLSSPERLSEKRNSSNHVIIQNFEKIESTALNKIHEFLKILEFPSERLIISESPDDLYAVARGSLKDGAIATISLSFEVIEEIEKNFTYEHAFCVAHELGHLFFDDNVVGYIETELKCCSVRFLAYGITFFVVQNLSTFSFLTTHLIGCISAKLIGIYEQRNRAFLKEFRADLWAAGIDSEITQGGINCLKKFEALKANSNKKTLKQLELEIKRAKSLVEKVKPSIKLSMLKLRLVINEKINFNMTHPSLTDRITAISKMV